MALKVPVVLYLYAMKHNHEMKQKPSMHRMTTKTNIPVLIRGSSSACAESVRIRSPIPVELALVFVVFCAVLD